VSESTATGGIRAFGPISNIGKQVGAIGFIFLVELLVFLAVLINSPILPGNWAPYLYPMLFYLVTLFGATLLFGFRRDLLATGGTISEFLFRLGAFGGATWLVMSLVFFLQPGRVAISGTALLQNWVFVAIFVAPVEEALFRVTLPKVFGNWILGSIVFFALYHIPAYYIETGGLGVGLVGALAQVAVLGFILWVVYAPQKDGGLLGMGYGASVGIHMVYDLFVMGAIGGLPLALAHLGLVPV
jgi:hypothetical protein